MRNSFKWAMTLMLCIGLLAGCANGKNSTSEVAADGDKASSDTTALTDVAKGSGELTVYTALEDDQIQAYLTSYKEQYPDVKLNIVRDSTGIITAKLIAEKDNPQADVIWGLAATSLLVLDQKGMLEGYDPAGIEKVSPEFKDTASPAKWVGIDAWETAIIANTVELKKRNLPVPQSYEDLIKPEYKGLLVMPNPSSSGTGYLTVNAFMQLMGPDKAWGYMDKLNDNMLMYTHSGSKPAKMAGTGEAVIGLSFGYRGIEEKKKGAPVEVVFPTEGSGWDVEANGLVKKADIKPEAKAFLDWAISDAPMKEYNKNYAILSVKQEGAAIPEGYSQDPLKQLIKNDLIKAASEREATLAEWDQRYASKSEPKS
ncbi:putative 2-aminoethylphosphonate ABC transporter substrate-binding protein [Paenibacillus selenitireducens]|uniref:Putative 2-aminoethylphosphonate ABC transporter substrate-binding protein n=1 Tax=Paenibacillus selenitireducens TaxID=1324314 RepID=A0A1T2X906_9BACL|nr:putative 2-aminoethylphosphonate ABC transporter substrate-binding protein [Paenibacillus selenitireducens]